MPGSRAPARESGEPDPVLPNYHRNLCCRYTSRIPRTHNSAHIATHTPDRPNCPTSSTESVSRTPQMLARFKRHGTRESPAPRRAPDATIDAANSGSANNSIRSTSVASCCTCMSGVSIRKIRGQATYIRIPAPVIIRQPSSVERLEKLFASVFLPAPMLCPTSVVAAFAIPYPGI